MSDHDRSKSTPAELPRIVGLVQDPRPKPAPTIAELPRIEGRTEPHAPEPALSADELSVDAQLRGMKVRAGARGTGIAALQRVLIVGLMALTPASERPFGGELGVLVGDGAEDERGRARGGRLTVLLFRDPEARRAMTKEIPSEFSLQVRRSARRTQLSAAARGAPAMVLAIAVLVLAVALAAYWLRVPRRSTGRRPLVPPGERPMAASWPPASRTVSTPRPARASFAFMTRTLSAASESSRTVVQ
jgi:hypothetical protein